MRTATLLECPDVETATRVLAALAGKAHRLTPTLFELAGDGPGAEAALLKRLRAAGVFLDGRPRGASDRSAARRGRRARRRAEDDAFD